MTLFQALGPVKPASLYIHVPFCRHRCGYCNFTLVANRDYLVPDYLRAVEMELAGLEECLELDTVYLGGGTPSRLSPQAFSTLLETVDRYFQLRPDCEFTMEANPEDLPGRLALALEDSPINRLSLGIQSFNPSRLGLLDRGHTPEQICKSIEFAHQSGMAVSLDLIFGAPGDTVELWADDLNKAVESGAGHLSTYELTIEKGTRFWNRQQKQESVKSSDDATAELYEQTIRSLGAAGFEHYEVSSFARAGKRSRHNQAYWSGRPWLAIGPGAAGLIDRTRYTNHRSVTRYLREVLAGRPAAEETQCLSPSELALEQIVFGLRRLEGINLVDWTRRTGFSLPDVVESETLERLVADDLISGNWQLIKLTCRGLMHGDYVCQQLFNAAILNGPRQT